MPKHIHPFISALPNYITSKLMNINQDTTGRRISNS